VLTLDLQIQGQRHRDLKNGLAVPPRLTWGTAFDILRKPGWALNVMTSKRKSFGNLEGRIPQAKSLTTLAMDRGTVRSDAVVEGRGVGSSGNGAGRSC